MSKDIQKSIRFLLILLMCAGFGMVAKAQNLGTYFVTRTTDYNYQYITNGNTLSWNCSANTDNAISIATAIGFNFPYNGLNCKTFYVSSNGFIVLDTISSSLYSTYPYPRYATNSTPGCDVATTNNYAYNDSCTAFYQNSSNNFSAMAIAPFYSDLITYYNGSIPLNDLVHYEVTGTSPNRVLTVEWYLMQLKGFTWNFFNWSYNYSFLMFQAKLYETSGTIEFWYAFNFYYPYNNLSSANKYVIGLNSNAYTSTLPNTNYILTDSIPGTASFSGNINFLNAPLYPDFYYHKITFSKPGADISVNTIYPPNPDTCGYSTSQIIVDTLVNTGSQSLTFNSTYPLKVYTQITGAINTLDSGIYTGSFPAGGTIAVQMSSPVNMSAGGTYNFKSYISSTIVTTTTTYTDENVTNDTATATYYVGSVTASSARSTICSGDTTQLSAVSTTFGHHSQIPYSAPAGGGWTTISAWNPNADDGSVTVNLPFTFYYFSRPKTSFQICTNGFIEFDDAYTNTNPTNLPSTIIYPTDVIALAWADLKPNYAGTVQYKTIGASPNREFIMEYAGIADTTTTTTLTAYLILHESTNIIEFQNDTIPSRAYTQGFEDSTGTIAYGLASRNSTTWSATQDAYLFVSEPSYTWSPSASLSNAYIANPIASPTVTTTYTVTLNGGNPGYPDSSGICPKTSTVTVTVNPGLGSLTPIVGDSNLCSNASASYQISPVTNATSYIWDVSTCIGAVITTGQGTDSITVTLGANSGFIKVRAYNSTCNIYTAWESVYITVAPNIYGPGQWVGGVSTDWFNTLNWCGGMPSSTVSAYIDGGYYTPLNYPVINGSGAVCDDLNLFGNDETLTINSSYNLDVYGSWYNGIYGFSTIFNPNSSSVTFRGSNSMEYINGYLPTTFNNITVNEGSDTTSVLQNVQGETIAMTGTLSLLNGLFMMEEPTSTIQFTGSSVTIPSTTGLQLDGGVLTANNQTITNYGLFRMGQNSSDIAIGTTSGNSFINSGSSALMQILGGCLTVASQITVSNGATFNFSDLNSNNYYNNNGEQDTIILNAFGTTSNTQALFNVDASSNAYITDGYFIFHNPNSGTGYDLRFSNGAGTKFIDPNSSSTFQFGDAGTTSSTATFKLVDTAGLILNNLALNPGGGHDTLYFYSPISLNTSGSLYLNSGILKLNSNGFVIYNQSDSAISRTTGFIVSEDTNNYGAITRYIPSVSGHQYIFPFGNKYGVYIPLKFTNLGNSADTVQVSTYSPSDSIRHKPLPLTVTQTRDSVPNHANDSTYMVNRYWQINANNVSTTNYATVVFSYAFSEKPAAGDAGGMKAQRWVAANQGWLSPWLVYNSVGGNQASSASTTTTAGTVTVTKLNHCSPWTLTSTGNPLPIELLSFTATNENNKYVLTSWVTASQINNDHFEIERSKEGINFEFVGTLPGAGNSNQTLYYSLNDDSPLMGLSYYRLKQVDFNGNFTYSEIVSVQFTSLQSVNIYPNPNDGNFTLSYNFSSQINTQVNASLQIFDITGRMVYSHALTTMQGAETIDASILSNGIYYWEVLSGSGVFDKGKIAIMK